MLLKQFLKRTREQGEKCGFLTLLMGMNEVTRMHNNFFGIKNILFGPYTSKQWKDNNFMKKISGKIFFYYYYSS